VLGQAGQLQARVHQGGDDLGQAVVPFVGHGVLEDHVGGGVGAVIVEHRRLRPLEVGVLHHQQPVLALVGQRPQHGVALAQEQPPARRQQRRHHVGPAADVRQPAQGADPRVHQPEPAPPEHVGRGADVGRGRSNRTTSLR
jgi:hypothetical protein